jgi:hypothetical protein
MTRGDILAADVDRPCETDNGKPKPVLTSCPFCGGATDLPHESQEACIAALRHEIARTREIVQRVRAMADAVSANDQNTGHPKPNK